MLREVTFSAHPRLSVNLVTGRAMHSPLIPKIPKKVSKLNFSTKKGFRVFSWRTVGGIHSEPQRTMPLVKIGRQLAEELRGLVDGVDRAESGKPSGLNTSADGRSGLAVTG